MPTIIRTGSLPTQGGRRTLTGHLDKRHGVKAEVEAVIEAYTLDDSVTPESDLGAAIEELIVKFEKVKNTLK